MVHHGHHHHHMYRLPQSQGKAEHHHGSGKYTVLVVSWVVICLVINLVWGCTGQAHP